MVLVFINQYVLIPLDMETPVLNLFINLLNIFIYCQEVSTHLGEVFKYI